MTRTLAGVCLFAVNMMLLLGSATIESLAQDPTPPRSSAPDHLSLSWDVISVRQNDHQSKFTRSGFTQDGYRATGVTLKRLIAAAFSVRGELVYGIPRWAENVQFDVAAKVGTDDISQFGALSKEQKNSLLANLLTERFGLKAHMETKELPIYELVIAKGGAKLQPSAIGKDYGQIAGMPDRSASGMSMTGPGMYVGNAVTISAFANAISLELERNVEDKTGILGRYDIELKYNPHRMVAITQDDNGNDADGEPSFFTAIEEVLGLKLQSAKGPVPVVIVDHVHPPSAN